MILSLCLFMTAILCILRRSENLDENTGWHVGTLTLLSSLDMMRMRVFGHVWWMHKAGTEEKEVLHLDALEKEILLLL